MSSRLVASTSAKILTRAELDTGRHERDFKGTPNFLLPDRQVMDWSAALRSLWGLETATALPPAHHNPQSWMEWGQAISINEAEPGDTVILRIHGHHHVGLWTAWQGQDCLSVFAGNSNDLTGRKTFPRTAIRGIRRLRM